MPTWLPNAQVNVRLPRSLVGDGGRRGAEGRPPAGNLPGTWETQVNLNRRASTAKHSSTFLLVAEPWARLGGDMVPQTVSHKALPSPLLLPSVTRLSSPCEAVWRDRRPGQSPPPAESPGGSRFPPAVVATGFPDRDPAPGGRCPMPSLVWEGQSPGAGQGAARVLRGRALVSEVPGGEFPGRRDPGRY